MYAGRWMCWTSWTAKTRPRPEARWPDLQKLVLDLGRLPGKFGQPSGLLRDELAKLVRKGPLIAADIVVPD